MMALEAQELDTMEKIMEAMRRPNPNEVNESRELLQHALKYWCKHDSIALPELPPAPSYCLMSKRVEKARSEIETQLEASIGARRFPELSESAQIAKSMSEDDVNSLF